jgi:hypothetical protein
VTAITITITTIIIAIIAITNTQGVFGNIVP